MIQIQGISKRYGDFQAVHPLDLDVRGARQIKQVFRDVAESGRTVFLSTHSLDVAEKVCDRLAIINKGRIVAQGTYAELRSGKRADARDLEEVFIRILEEKSQPASEA